MTKARILADYVAGGTTAAEFDYLDGLTSAAVGINDTQTLTNKTLTSPTIGNLSNVTGTLPVGVTGGSGLNAVSAIDCDADSWLYTASTTTTYSSAIFEQEGQKLEEAQQNKYEKLTNLLSPKNGSKLLEIGCGWGGFAEYLGKKYDVKLDCITISKKQYEFAKERIYKSGLNHKVNIEMIDYRDVKKKYDSIASIEMIEAVGKDYLHNYFQSIKKNLVANGKAGIQAITIDDKYFDRYKTKQDFIQKYIFPGGFLPSKIMLYNYANKNGLEIGSYNSYGLHYSNTLILWRDEFLKKWDLISKQGFNLTFKRMWDFYLSYCEAGFKSKNIDLIQFSLQNR